MPVLRFLAATSPASGRRLLRLIAASATAAARLGRQHAQRDPLPCIPAQQHVRINNRCRKVWVQRHEAALPQKADQGLLFTLAARHNQQGIKALLNHVCDELDWGFIDYAQPKVCLHEPTARLSPVCRLIDYDQSRSGG